MRRETSVSGSGTQVGGHRVIPFYQPHQDSGIMILRLYEKQVAVDVADVSFAK